MAVDDRPERPEYAAAVANALVVLLAPMVLLFAGSLMPQCPSDTNVTVPASGGPEFKSIATIVFSMASGLVPAAAVAGWRTLVLARRWRHDRRGDWRGVAEAAGCGFLVALIVLAPGIVTRPLEAPPYVIAYGGAALVLGVVVGLVLRAIALTVLKAAKAP